MKKVILGATGSIGSSLAKKLIESGDQVHLVGRDEASISSLANELDSSYTTCDVLEENFSDKILSDLGETPVNGLAFCVGSIDLKPLKLTKRSDFMQSFNLNLISATEAIKALADNLKKNKGSVVLFSTVAIKQGFPNHAIVASAKALIISAAETKFKLNDCMKSLFLINLRGFKSIEPTQKANPLTGVSPRSLIILSEKFSSRTSHVV